MFQPETIDRKITESPTFEGFIDPIELLQNIDDFMLSLNEDNSNSNTERIMRELDTWQILTTSCQNTRTWLIEPLRHVTTTKRRTLLHRIGKLIETGGEWYGETVETASMDIPTRCPLPLTLIVVNGSVEQLEENKAQSLLVILNQIHYVVRSALKDGVTAVGVFEKPTGVINMNTLRSWLNNHRIQGAEFIEHDLEIMTIADMVRETTFEEAPTVQS